MDYLCRQCGAKAPLKIHDQFQECPFCASHLFLDRASSFKHLALGAKVRVQAARRSLCSTAARRGHSFPDNPELEQLLLPFWGVRGQDVQETVPAFSPCPLAISSYQLPAAQANWFREEEYPGFEVVPPSDNASAAWGGDEQGVECILYSVPFYRARYGKGQEPFEAFLDAATGKAYWGLSPPCNSGGYSSRFVRSTLALIGAFALESMLLPGLALPALAIGITAAAAFPFFRGFIGGGRGT